MNGKVIPSVSHLIDIMPTVLEVTNTTAQGEFPASKAVNMDGHSLAAAFEGKPIQRRETLFFHHAKGRALRHGHWKLVAENKNPWELYDLKSDPLEEHDLAKNRPEKVKELSAIWDRESKRLAKQANRR